MTANRFVMFVAVSEKCSRRNKHGFLEERDYIYLTNLIQTFLDGVLG